jgi:hypothetical protein
MKTPDPGFNTCSNRFTAIFDRSNPLMVWGLVSVAPIRTETNASAVGARAVSTAFSEPPRQLSELRRFFA